MDKIFTEKELILPALKIIAEQTLGISTSELIHELRSMLQPSGRDILKLKGRSDDVFSQKVRNLISHKSITKYVDISKDKMFINDLGLLYIEDMSSDDYSPYIENNDDFRDENYSSELFEKNIEPDNIYLSVSDLKRKYDRWKNGIDENALLINPDFQRYDGVWSTKNKSLFIESIILNIPIPSIYLSENSKGTLVVIDGRQRLSTLFDFMEDKFTLKGLTILEKLNGKKYSKLVGDFAKYKTKIEDRSLHIEKLRYGTSDTFIIETFERVNTKGAKLNAQEIRNAINQGKSTRLLNDLSNLYSGTHQIVDKKRMKDKYLILRYFAMKSYYQSIKQGEDINFKSISDYLSYTMKRINKFSDEDVSFLKEDFIRTYDRAIEVFGERAFRFDVGLPINMILFDVVLIIVSELLNKSAEEIIDVYNQLINFNKNYEDNSETPFEKNIKYHRDSEENIKERMLWIKMIIGEYDDKQSYNYKF